MQTVKSGDYIFTNEGKFGTVTYAYEQNGETKVQYLHEDDNDYNYKTTYPDYVIVIPVLKFANNKIPLNKVKPGSLVQIVSSGKFCHITRLVTAESDDIYIETTQVNVTFDPSELNFIG